VGQNEQPDFPSWRAVSFKHIKRVNEVMELLHMVVDATLHTYKMIYLSYLPHASMHHKKKIMETHTHHHHHHAHSCWWRRHSLTSIEAFNSWEFPKAIITQTYIIWKNSWNYIFFKINFLIFLNHFNILYQKYIFYINIILIYF